MTALMEKTTTVTVSQAIIAYLAAQKRECFDGSILPFCGGVWGIFGHGNVAGIGEALSKMKETMPFYRGQNEQSMAHAAVGFAKANRAARFAKAKRAARFAN